jgi:hypothetical protein
MFAIGNTNGEQLTIQVTDITGKTIEFRNSTTNQLDLSDQALGMYYIRIMNQAGNVLHAQSVLIHK